MEKIIKRLNSVLLCMEAHPDNEPDSEFADRISDLKEILLELNPVANCNLCGGYLNPKNNRCKSCG